MESPIVSNNKVSLNKFVEHLGLDLNTKLSVKDGMTLHAYSDRESEARSTVLQFFTRISSNDQFATQKLESSYSWEHEGHLNKYNVSKRDVLFAILSCCDYFILQHVFSKLYDCGSAIPILLPAVRGSDVTLMLWSSRRCSDIVPKADTIGLTKINLCKHPLLTVSALRFGVTKVSKSEILNSVVAQFRGNGNANCFLTYQEHESQSCWSQGSVEMGCVVSHNIQNMRNVIPSLSFLNLRGDALKYTRQKDFCIDVSRAVIIFLPKEITEVHTNEVNRMSKLTKFLIVLQHDYQEQTFDIQSDYIMHINVDRLTPHEVVNQLCHHLKRFSQRKSALTETLEAYSKSCSTSKIEFDEKDFEGAKTLASSVITEVFQSLSTHQEAKKERLPSVLRKKMESSPDEQRLLLELRYKTYLKQLSETPLSATLILFLKCLQFDYVNKMIFLSFLKISLDIKAFNVFETLMAQYKTRLFEPLRIENLSEEYTKLPSMGNFDIGDDPLYEVSFPTNDTGMYVGSFLRQLWELLQCSHPDVSVDPGMYGELLATCIIHGHSINILTYESKTAPSKWTTTVMESLHSLLGEKSKVRVVSILGGFTSDKSTLLNHLFGAKFTDSENLFFQGIWLQLLPVHNKSKAYLGFNYLLLLNVESVWLSEIINQGHSERREYISSLVSSITDMLIICINQTETEEEKSAIFDMAVHGILMADNYNVLRKCCVVYQLNDTKTTDIQGLEKYTFQRIEESCGKIYSKSYSLPPKGNCDKKSLFVKVRGYFICKSGNQPPCKCIKHVQSSHKNLYGKLSHDYVRSLSDFREFVLDMLAKLQTDACSFLIIGERVKDSVKDSTYDSNSLSPVYFHHVSSTSVEENIYFIFRKKCLKVKVQLVTAFKKGFKIGEDVSFRKLKKLEIAQAAFAKMRQTFLSLAKNKFSSTQYEVIVQSLQEISDEFESRISKELQKEIENTNKVMANRKILRNEQELISANLDVIKMAGKATVDKQKETAACLETHADRIIKNYPLVNVEDINAETILHMNHKLKEEKYGEEVSVLTQSAPLAECFVPYGSMLSKKDLVESTKKFNSKDKKDENILIECKNQLDDLSLTCEEFEKNARDLVSIVESYLKRLTVSPEKLTMFIFIFIKFIFNSHREQLILYNKAFNGAVDSADFHACAKERNVATTILPLEGKVQYVLSIARNNLTDAEFQEFHSAVTAENAKNFDHVPFNIRTLQRLDRNFLRLLPSMSPENLNNLLDAVNDAKVFCFGKALAKASYNFDEWFGYVFKVIQVSLVNDKNSKQIKAAAFVHVCAWASQLVNAKKYQREKEINVGEQFKNKIPLLELGLQLSARELIKDKLCEILCSEFEEAVSDSLPDEIQSKLMQCLLDENRHLLIKRQFIGNILRSFCVKDSFKNIMSFVTDYEVCSSKWVLEYIAERINDKTESLLKNIRTDIITEKVEIAKSCVNRAILLCLSNADNRLHSFIDTIKENVLSEMNYSIFNDYTIFELLEEKVQLNDLESYLEMSQDMSLSLRRNLTKNIELPEEGNVDDTKSWILSLPGDMHNNFSRSVVGCIKQCPLCGTVCNHQKSEHGIHSPDCHLPVGFKGVRDKRTARLLKFNCISVVKQTERVKFDFHSDDDDNNDDRENRRHSSIWEDLYIHWDIFESRQEDPSIFWKYIFKHFQCELSQHYECPKSITLSEWDSYSKEDAIKSLETTYKLESSKDRLASGKHF